MKKRIVCIITMIFVIFSSNVFAYSGDSFNGEVRIGLRNMVSTSMSLSLTGDYTVNGTIMKSNSAANLKVVSGKVDLNGKQYSSVTFEPRSSNNLLTINVGAKKYNYMGKVEFTVSGSSILPINTIDIEDYLMGVVGYEMSNSYPLEALKAQAVAARGYTIANLDKHKSLGYDLCDTTDCQVYKGYNASYKNVIRAVEETRGDVLYYGNAIADTYFAASDGGYTEASENIWTAKLPYLITKKDEFDNEPWPYGNETFTTKEMQDVLRQKGYIGSNDTLIKLDLDSIKRYTSSRVASIDIVYNTSAGQKRKSFTKDAARYFLSLPSSMYSVVYNSSTDTYTFSGKGYGHGVGMSQIGARNRANNGQTYDKILKFYFDGTTIKNISSKISSFTIDKNAILIGGSVNLTAVTTNPQNQLFKFVIKKNGKDLYTGSYGANSKLSYTPKENGQFEAWVYTKDKYSSEDENSKSIKFTVYKLPVITDIKLPASIYQKNKFKVESVISSDRSPLYKYNVIYGGKTILTQDYSQNSSYEMTLDNPGQYKIQVYVKDIDSTKTYDSFKEKTFTVLKGNPPANSQTPTTVKKLSITKVLKNGSKGAEVTSLETALKYLGYNVKVDGVYDANTVSAVKAFQKSAKLTQDGIAGPKTYAAINAAIDKKAGASKSTGSTNTSSSNSSSTAVKKLSTTKVLKNGSKGAEVTSLETALKYLGYNVKVDGIYDANTVSAVKAFQKSAKLTQDGIAGPKTYAAINSRLK